MQVSINQNTPIVVTIIQNYCNQTNIDRDEIIREIANKCFKDVIPRFQYTNNTFYRHYHELQHKRYKMPSNDMRYIYLFKESIELFRENYEELNVEVVEEWGRLMVNWILSN